MSGANEQAAGVQPHLTPICAIGASAGGLKALQGFFSTIEPNLGLSYVIIIHLSPDHPSQLAEILANTSPMPVNQVDDAPELKPDHVYVIPPDRQLIIEGNRIKARPFKEPRGQRAPIDMFFRSTAEARGDGFAIVLSGVGTDGAVGVRKVKEAGGLILVQDPTEAEFVMMPRSAIATGVADFIEPVARLAERVGETMRSKKALAETASQEADQQIGRIISFLRARTGHDFLGYKQATIRRRIGRRMQVTRQESLADYARHISETPEEAQALFADLLISVTSFFRDEAAFNHLSATVIPSLFERHNHYEPLRIILMRNASSRPERSPGSTHAAMLEKNAPPSVIVDEEHRIINLSPRAGRFIAPPEGPLSHELPDIVRPELRAELRSALHRAFSASETTVCTPIVVKFDDVRRRIAMFVAPSLDEPTDAPMALVAFMDSGPAGTEEDLADDAAPGSQGAEIRRLREELRSAQERLSDSRRDHENSVQELRIANEELQSVNEEYRSTAEELETSKEELQSINEELQTVNAELKAKLDSIASAHSDLQNLINATEIGTLFLDVELRIKMLTPAVEQLFSVTDSDAGRPITDFTHKLVYDGVENDARKVLRTLAPSELEVETKDGRWLMMRLRPYRTVEDRIEGVVVSFVDITARREVEDALRQSEERYRAMVKTMEVASETDRERIHDLQEQIDAQSRDRSAPDEDPID